MDIVLLRDKIRYDGGGASRSIHLLAEQLTERGHDVEVITVHFSGEQNNIPEDPNYTLTERPISNRTQIDGAIQIRRVLGEVDSADILHCFQPQLHPIVGEWKRKNPAVSVVGRLNTYENFCTNHSLIADECYKNCGFMDKWNHHPDVSLTAIPKMAFDTWVQPRLLNKFDRLFALSPAVAKIFGGYGVDEQRLTVIPNFYEDSFGKKCPNGDPTAGSTDSYRLIYVGRLVQKKGVHTLIDAVEESAVTPKVDIVGEGPKLNSLKRNSSERITFHGWVDHDTLPSYYERADVFVHPGLWPEPFGRTVLEAMQCGCVPVVSEIGGPPWIVGDAGVQFPRGDSAQLRTTIDSLADQQTRDRFTSQISKELERFTPETVIAQIESEYEKIQ